MRGIAGGAKSPFHQPWRLPSRGLAVFHGTGDVARLSHYFLPRLLMAGQRVLFLDGANSADPRLLARLARERGAAFDEFSRQIQIARAFTCFQLTELIARVPRLLRDFPARVLIVTAFPDLYFDEDIRDGDARAAFEQALRDLGRWTGEPRTEGRPRSAGPAEKCPLTPAPLPPGEGSRGPFLTPCPLPQREGVPPVAGRMRERGPVAVPLAVAVFSAAATFAPSPARRRFFERLGAQATEAWKFSLDEDRRTKLICERGPLSLGPVAALDERRSREILRPDLVGAQDDSEAASF